MRVDPSPKDRTYRKNPEVCSGREIAVASEKPIRGNVLLRLLEPVWSSLQSAKEGGLIL